MNSESGSRRIVVVTLDTIRNQMAGPAIRAWEISRYLTSLGHHVELVTFSACEQHGDGFECRHVSVGEFRAVAEASDVVVLQGFVTSPFPWLADLEASIVVDLYDPFQLESLEVDKFSPLRARHEALDRALTELRFQLDRGDFFLCASEKQRDLWLGALSLRGRITPELYDEDVTLRRLISVAPFGLSETPPAVRKNVFAEVFPQIEESDPIVLWGGGVYNWFDPLTVIRAISEVRKSFPSIRLVFLGMRHPNPDVPEMQMAVRARQLADELGLTNTTVFFHEEWIPYKERSAYLTAATLGVSAHFDHLETRFSFRTRMLDYLWAHLPIVSTEGDSFAHLIEERDLGAVVAVEDFRAMGNAIEGLLADPIRREAVRSSAANAAQELVWHKALAALGAFCAAPYRTSLQELDEEEVLQVSKVSLRDMKAVVRTLRSDGPSAVIDKVLWRIKRVEARLVSRARRGQQ